MKSRVAKKVFLQASQGLTNYKLQTLAKAARKFTHLDIAPREASICFVALWMRKRVSGVLPRYEEWLENNTNAGIATFKRFRELTDPEYTV